MPQDPDSDRGQSAGGLTTAEAADKLGVRPRTVRRYIDQGKLKTMGKVTGEGAVESWLIDPGSVDTLSAQKSADMQRGHVRGTEGLTLSDSAARTLRQIVREEMSAGQKALQPSEEELRERAEREQRIEEALAGNADTIRELAEDLGRVQAERDQLRQELDEAQQRIADLEAELEEARRPWWRGLLRRD